MLAGSSGAAVDLQHHQRLHDLVQGDFVCPRTEGAIGAGGQQPGDLLLLVDRLGSLPPARSTCARLPMRPLAARRPARSAATLAARARRLAARRCWLFFPMAGKYAEPIRQPSDCCRCDRTATTDYGEAMLIAFSVAPSGVGELSGCRDAADSVSVAVAEAVRIVRESGMPNQTDSMFTTLEGDWDECMDVVKRACDAVGRYGSRVSLVLKADIRPGHAGELTGKWPGSKLSSPRPVQHGRRSRERLDRIVTARIRIGLSGWNYPHWRNDFYPAGLPQRRELEFASRAFEALELNGSFYSLQRPSSYAQVAGRPHRTASSLRSRAAGSSPT